MAGRRNQTYIQSLFFNRFWCALTEFFLQIMVVVEALKNICGISWSKSSEMYGNYNIRKFQSDLLEKKSIEDDSSLPAPDQVE